MQEQEKEYKDRSRKNGEYLRTKVQRTIEGNCWKIGKI